jgi:hypothetical protein
MPIIAAKMTSTTTGHTKEKYNLDRDYNRIKMKRVT